MLTSWYSYGTAVKMVLMIFYYKYNDDDDNNNKDYMCELTIGYRLLPFFIKFQLEPEVTEHRDKLYQYLDLKVFICVLF